MSNFSTPSRLGLKQGGSDADALFLVKFSGEVLTAYNAKNMMMSEDQQIIRRIENGKSAQFPVIGTASASYHTPGSEIDPGAIAATERLITIDGKLLSAVFVDELDELKNHYDVRSEYSRQLGEALANQSDKQILQTLVLTARMGSNLTGGNGGSTLTNAAFATSGVAIGDGIFDGMQILDEKNVTEDGRMVKVRPAQYWLMARSKELMNRDYGGRGSFADGKILNVAGATIQKTNNLPSTNVTTGLTKYQGNFSNTVGVIHTRAAMGTLQLMGMTSETEYSVRHQGTLLVSKMAVGHGGLRPECAIELAKA